MALWSIVRAGECVGIFMAEHPLPGDVLLDRLAHLKPATAPDIAEHVAQIIFRGLVYLSVILYIAAVALNLSQVLICFDWHEPPFIVSPFQFIRCSDQSQCHVFVFYPFHRFSGLKNYEGRLHPISER